MNIVFQFGEFTGDESSFWSDLIVAVVGAFIGTGGAILLYYRQIKDQKQKEFSSLYNTQKDQLEYLYHLLGRTIITTDKMIVELARFNEFVIKNPTKKSTLMLTVNSDLNRIVNRINQDSYFLAYKALIKDNKIGSILANVDYLFEVLEDIKSYYISINNTQDRDRKNFLESMQDLIKLILMEANNYLKTEGKAGGHYIFFSYYLQMYGSFFRPDIDDLKVFDDKFLTPLLNHIQNDRIPSEYHQTYELANKCSVALERLKLKNVSEANHLGDFVAGLSNPLQKLKDLTLPLKNFLNI